MTGRRHFLKCQFEFKVKIYCRCKQGARIKDVGGMTKSVITLGGTEVQRVTEHGYGLSPDRTHLYFLRTLSWAVYLKGVQVDVVQRTIYTRS